MILHFHGDQGVNSLKAALVFSVLSVVVGGVVGSSLANRDFDAGDNHFGPFRLGQPASIARVREVMEARQAAGVPKAEVVGGNVHDFGVMQRNAKSNHRFVVKNVGTGLMELEVVGSTCKCTVGTLQEQSLAPGESTEVYLEWTAKTPSNKFVQSATLKTTDPTRGELKLEIQGTVIDFLAAEPSSWNIGDVASTSPIELKTTLFNYSKTPIQIVKLGWLDEAFMESSETVYEQRQLSQEELDLHPEALEAIDVRASIPVGTAQGALNKRLRIEYRDRGDDEMHPPLELVLTGRIVGPLSVLGGAKLSGTERGVARLTLGRVDPGKVAEEKIYVVLRGPERDTVKLNIGVVDPSDALEVELGESTLRGEMRLFPLTIRTKASALEMDRSGENGSLPGTITVESDDAEVASISIGVLFRIGKPFGS